jgi:hypothetical protein
MYLKGLHALLSTVHSSYETLGISKSRCPWFDKLMFKPQGYKGIPLWPGWIGVPCTWGTLEENT